MIGCEIKDISMGNQNIKFPESLLHHQNPNDKMFLRRWRACICTHSITPSLKTCRELASVEVAPTNAEESVNGVTTTLSGTSVNASFPLILRVPSLRTGFVLRNMEGLHSCRELSRRRPPCARILCFEAKEEENRPESSCRNGMGGGNTVV